GPEIADNGVDDDCVGGDLKAAAGVGLYVAKTGADTNPGTKASPKLTIGAALTAAQANASPVFVAEGVYNEYVTVGTSIFGGYEATGWTHDFAAHASEIHPSTSTTGVSVARDVMRPVVIGSMRVYAGTNSGSCYAITVQGHGIVALVSDSYVDGGTCNNTVGVDAEYGGF